MVTDWIIQALAAFVSWVLGLFPVLDMPDWVATVVTFVSSTVTNALALGNWIPWPMVGLAFVFIWAAWLVALGIRVARITASFFTAGGGSAA